MVDAKQSNLVLCIAVEQFMQPKKLTTEIFTVKKKKKKSRF